MKIGLTDEEKLIIQNILRAFPEITSVLLFGSRARNTNQVASDVDIALKGKIDFDVLSKVKAALEASPLPYFFDVIDYQNLENPDLREHTDRYGVEIFNK